MPKVYLLGHSHGAFVAAYQAIHRPAGPAAFGGMQDLSSDKQTLAVACGVLPSYIADYWGVEQRWAPLRAIDTALTGQAAESLFEEFPVEWEPKSPAMIAVWRNSWEQFTPFLEFPAPIRKLVYTTNAIEGAVRIPLR